MRPSVPFEFINVWGNFPPHLSASVERVWREHGYITDAHELQRRREEVVWLIMAGDQVAGISTAYKTFVSQLDHYFYAFRCLIVPEFRAAGLDTALVVKTRDFLESIYQQETDKQAKGMIMVIQNETVKQNWRKAVWPGAGMIYIGETTQGDHVRVTYFKGAKI